MADSTDISVFGQETFFNEKVNCFKDISVSGNVNFTGNLYQNGSLINISNISGNESGNESVWVTTAAGIHTLSNVGIGITNPTSKLQVDGLFCSGYESITAAGTDQNTATQITKNMVFIGSGSGGIRLPNAPLGTRIFIRNSLPGSITVYPYSSETILGSSSNSMTGYGVKDYVLMDVVGWIPVSLTLG